MNKIMILCLAFGIAACSNDDKANNANNNENNANNLNNVNNENNVTSDTGSEDTSSTADVGTDSTSDQNSSDTGVDSSTDMAVDSAPDIALRIPRGTCESDADCAQGSCVNIGDDPNTAWRTCAVLYPEQTTCGNEAFDECCKSDECNGGLNGVCLQPVPACQGIRPEPFNLCYYDECTTDADCTAQPNGMCAPGGVWGAPTKSCTYGDCQLDSDCNGGTCIPFEDPCVGRLTGFFCVNDDSECKNDADCANAPVQGIPYCAPGPNGPTCQGFFPPA